MRNSIDDLLRNWISDAIKTELRTLPERVARLKAVEDDGRGTTPVFMTAEQVATLAQVRPQTVRTWVSAGALPAHYAGRKLRIRLDEFEAFMQRGREQPESHLTDDDDRVQEILASVND